MNAHASITELEQAMADILDDLETDYLWLESNPDRRADVLPRQRRRLRQLHTVASLLQTLKAYTIVETAERLAATV